MSTEIRTKEQQAFDTLAELGGKFYEQEYREEVDKWDKAGRALSALSDYGKNFGTLVYAALEELNQHSRNAVVELLFNLDDKPRMMARDIPAILATVNREVEVLGEWNAEKLEYAARRARVKLVVEYLDKEK